MNARSTALIVGLAAMIGAGVTWLWMHEADVPEVMGSRDDTTYRKVLASASFFPQSKDVIRSISERHEQFVLTPDSDADWGRRTEKALRDFFQTSASDGAVQITSVSCRSDACEVQAELQQKLPSAADDSAEIRPGADPAAAMHEERLFGGSLRQEKSVGLSVDRDHIGFVTWYKRMETPADTRSP